MNIATYIEHTNLKPEATAADIQQLCHEAIEHHFAAVCVNSGLIYIAHEALQGTPVLLSCVVGFPLGAMATAIKATETAYAISHGADEIDMVIAIGAVKAGDWDAVTKDIHQVVQAAEHHPVKVILETGLLTEPEKIRACEVAVAAGATYVKTSTGFGHGGATISDVQLMRRVVGPRARIKASGGIRDYETAVAMITAGADRLGTSSGVAIIQGETHE